MGASWPQHEIAVRGHVWAEGAQNGRKAEAEADGDGDGEGEKEKKAVTSQTVPYQLFMRRTKQYRGKELESMTAT